MNNSLSIVDKEVKKHIAAIRISDNVGLLARKMWNVLLMNAYDDLLVAKRHKISVGDLCELTGCNTRNHKSFIETLKTLMTTVVSRDVGGQCTEKGLWSADLTMCTFLGPITISKGVVHYKFHEELATLLYNPEIYQRISIAQQKLFKSSNSLALWENCLRYIGVGTTGLVEVGEWKILLGSTSKAYEQYREFNKSVISPAIKEINAVSTIEIEPFYEKKGRKVTHIGFHIKQKAQQQLALSELMEEGKASKEFHDLVALGISDIQALSMIQEHGLSYIRTKLEFLDEKLKTGKVKNPSGFIVSAIKGDFIGEKQIAQEKEKKQTALNLSVQADAKSEELRSKYSKEFARLEKEKFLSGLSEKQQNELIAKILSSGLVDRYAANVIKSKGLSAPSAGKYILEEIKGFEQRKDEYIEKMMGK